jgi:cytochrome c556
MPTLALLVTTLALAGLAVAAESDPISDRQDEMEGSNKAMKTLSGIARKQAPFDAAVVQQNATAIASHLDTAKGLFPEGSDKGGMDTWAKPEIWTHRADFDTKLEAAHAAAVDLAKVADEAAYLPALGKLGNACKACHESYRRPKEQ